MAGRQGPRGWKKRIKSALLNVISLGCGGPAIFRDCRLRITYQISATYDAVLSKKSSARRCSHGLSVQSDMRQRRLLPEPAARRKDNGPCRGRGLGGLHKQIRSSSDRSRSAAVVLQLWGSNDLSGPQVASKAYTAWREIRRPVSNRLEFASPFETGSHFLLQAIRRTCVAGSRASAQRPRCAKVATPRFASSQPVAPSFR